ncbi:Cytochrome P450 monooxygenase [Penicillium ucsense]|uniref:Cytochrome P450 monooxygenase n=1 Tax=Penicillium ucsense TaxID=2839758 RepID=A0A8J8WH82_9EURO|nr:Cytochrome P450 monooxygenase [Penicillium ucsense]KAF7736433.1 Cytochrome P450 monooxygenase [Penicillium ucsense]
MAFCIVWPILGLFLVLYLLRQKPDARLANIPIFRYSNLLPDLFNRFIFYPKGVSLIYAGYQKYKNEPFRLLTGDGELLVLPIRYSEELKHLPPAILNSLDAQYENALGDFTNILINSYLPSNTVRKRLTPSIDRWTSIKAHQMFVHLIARSTSRILTNSLRRNEQWLEVASNYSVNVGITILLLRPFPHFFRPFVAPFLPSVRQMKKQLRTAKSLFIPIIQERRAAEAAGDPQYEKPDDFLQWMMDMAEDEQDLDPEIMAHHNLILTSLAVVHTSSVALCHVLYDLIQHPEYIEPLREEMTRTLSKGWEHANKASFDAQKRLDSFLRESQRWGPPGELSMHRIVREPLTLSDGLHLPKGIHICFPSGPVSKDPAFVFNPAVFDGFRWCQDPRDRDVLKFSSLRSSNQIGNEAKTPNGVNLNATPVTSFISISPANMHFGFGRQACPGRFFAANTIKAILSRLIMEYDFKFENNQVGWRPANIGIGEHVFPNTQTVVLLRRRQKCIRS